MKTACGRHLVFLCSKLKYVIITYLRDEDQDRGPSNRIFPFLLFLSLFTFLFPSLFKRNQRRNSRPYCNLGYEKRKTLTCHPIGVAPWQAGILNWINLLLNVYFPLPISSLPLRSHFKNQGSQVQSVMARTHFMDLGTSEHCSSRMSTPEPHGVPPSPYPALPCPALPCPVSTLEFFASIATSSAARTFSHSSFMAV